MDILCSQFFSICKYFSSSSLERANHFCILHPFFKRVSSLLSSLNLFPLLFATLLLRGVFVQPIVARLLQWLLLLRSRFRDIPPDEGISEKLLKRIPLWRSFVDRWNSQMLARYSARRKYVSLSLEAFAFARLHTFAHTQRRDRTHTPTNTSSLLRNHFQS